MYFKIVGEYVENNYVYMIFRENYCLYKNLSEETLKDIIEKEVHNTDIVDYHSKYFYDTIITMTGEEARQRFRKEYEYEL